MLSLKYNTEQLPHDQSIEILFNDVHVATVQMWNNFLDFTNELDRKNYNLLEIAESGAIINDNPKLDN
jgi:hypothetical protein